MAEQVKGPIDFAVWGPVILNLAYNNLARELWLDAKLEPHVPTFTTIMQCSTSMIAVFEAAGMLGYGGTALGPDFSPRGEPRLKVSMVNI
jgi:acetyl-CoA C-acetyltransferase